MKALALLLLLATAALAQPTPGPPGLQAVNHDSSMTGDGKKPTPLGVRLAVGGGLTDAGGTTGIGLRTDCSANQSLNWVGSAWICSSVAANVLSIVSTNIFPIISYGAKCDGVTDDTVAIQAAIDAASAVNGEAYVNASASTCVFTNLKLGPYMKLAGAHMFSSSLTRKAGSTGIAIREKTVAEGNLSGATGIWIQDLAISGAGGAGDGIDLGNQTALLNLSTYAGMSNVLVTHFPSGKCMNINSNASSFSYIWANDCQTGVNFSGTGGSANVIHSLFSEVCTLAALTVGDLGDKFFGVQIESAAMATPSISVSGADTLMSGVFVSISGNSLHLIENTTGAVRNVYRDVALVTNAHTFTQLVYDVDSGVGTGAAVVVPEFVVSQNGNVASYYINQSTGHSNSLIGDVSTFAQLGVTGNTALGTVNTNTTAILGKTTITGNAGGSALDLTSAAVGTEARLLNTATGGRTWVLGSGASTCSGCASSFYLYDGTGSAFDLTIDAAGTITDLHALAVNGNTTLGDASTDTTTINGATTILGPAANSLDVRASYDPTVANSGQFRVSETSSFRGSIGYDEAGSTAFVFDNSYAGNAASLMSFRFGNSQVMALTQDGKLAVAGAETVGGALGVTGVTTTTGGLLNGGAWKQGGTVTVTGIGTTLTDYAPTGIASASILDITNTTAIAFTGISAGQINGSMITVRVNASSVGTINFVHMDGTSLAANRFRMTGAANWVLRQGSTITFQYNGSEWAQIGVSTLAYPSMTMDGTLNVTGASTLTGLLRVGAGTDVATVSNNAAIFENAGTTSIAVRDATNDHEFYAKALTGGGVEIGSSTNDVLAIRTNNVVAIGIDTSQNVQFSAQVLGTGTAPALTACGTSPSIVGDDFAGIITVGTSTTTCQITFAHAFANEPSCVAISNSTTNGAISATTKSASTVTFSPSATALSGVKLNYICVGR